MNLPFSASTALWLAIPFGALFGVLLQRGGVVDYNKIVNQFRLRDFTMLKIMLTAILVGGVGVLVLHGVDLAAYHIKPANLLAVALGAALFGVGMVLYGYCPGTGIAACATGSVHGLVGFAGMLAGGVLYAYCYPWLEAHVQTVAAFGKVRLPDLTPLPAWAWFAFLAVVALGVFRAIALHERRPAVADDATR